MQLVRRTTAEDAPLPDALYAQDTYAYPFYAAPSALACAVTVTHIYIHIYLYLCSTQCIGVRVHLSRESMQLVRRTPRCSMRLGRDDDDTSDA
jgi:hypothetical protein